LESKGPLKQKPYADELRQKIIKAYVKFGNETAAARAVDLSRSSISREKAAFPEFEEAMKEAKEEFIDIELEERAMRIIRGEEKISMPQTILLMAKLRSVRPEWRSNRDSGGQKFEGPVEINVYTEIGRPKPLVEVGAFDVKVNMDGKYLLDESAKDDKAEI